MDASDLANKNRNQAVYGNKLNTISAANPAGDCTNLNTNCGNTSSCIRRFESFQDKYSFYMGRNASVTTAGVPTGDLSFGIVGCIMPVNGGGQ